MNNPLVSVIVPIYNVEVYLRRCLDSVLRQTYRNIEIVLVDDGSPDRCPEICDEYAKNDNRIKVIHQKNGGLAHARNVGIANSKGEYISFIDSDDFVSEKYVEILYYGIEKNNADVSIASFQRFEKDSDLTRSVNDFHFSTMSLEKCFECYCSIKANVSMSFISAWGKIYRKTLFEGVEYPKGRLYEDAFTTYKLLDKAKKIVYTENAPYYYFVNPQSILGQSFKKKHLDMVDAFQETIKFFKDEGKLQVANLFYEPLLMREIYCWWGCHVILGDRETSNKLLFQYKSNLHCFETECEVALLKRILFRTFACFPHIYSFYRFITPIYLGNR